MHLSALSICNSNINFHFVPQATFQVLAWLATGRVTGRVSGCASNAVIAFMLHHLTISKSSKFLKALSTDRISGSKQPMSNSATGLWSLKVWLV